MLLHARYQLILLFLLSSNASAQSHTDTLATADPARKAILIGLQAARLDLGTFSGPICVEARAYHGVLLELPASMLRGPSAPALIRARNCPATFATNGGYVDPETGVSDNPVPPPGYVDPMWILLQLAAHRADSLPFLRITLRQGPGFRLLECDYSRLADRPYICGFRGGGAN